MRTHFTKPLISEALFRLLKTKSINDITVVELVKTAGVSKASFYRNYLDINQVIAEYLDNVFGDLYEIAPIRPKHIKKSITTILEHIYKHREQINLLSRNGLLSNIDKYLYDSTLKEIQKLQVLDNRYQPYFFAGATSGFISGWIENNFTDSPSVMADYFIKSLHGYMKI